MAKNWRDLYNQLPAEKRARIESDTEVESLRALCREAAEWINRAWDDDEDGEGDENLLARLRAAGGDK